MRVSVGADGRLPVVDSALKYLEEKGHEVTWYGPESVEQGYVPYPNVAKSVAEDVASGRADEGIILCWTGTGVTISANKIRGVRAALCDDAETARGARLWNNANVLTLSMRRTSEIIAREILDSWFGTKYASGEDTETDESLEQLYDLDDKR